ncbi:hypothetical protein RB195_008711 [Necator americanus]
MKGLLILMICFSSVYRGSCMPKTFSDVFREYDFAIWADVVGKTALGGGDKGYYKYEVVSKEIYKGEMMRGKSYDLSMSYPNSSCAGLTVGKTYLLAGTSDDNDRKQISLCRIL